MGVGVMGGAKQLIDIAFTVADMDASLGLGQQSRGLPDIIKPADAFLFFDRNPSEVDLVLKRVGSFELLSGPKLDGGDSQRKSFGCHHETGMHEDAASPIKLGLA